LGICRIARRFEARYATQLLLEVTGVPEEDWNPDGMKMQAQEVVKLLGSHTFALIQAGADTSQRYCTLVEYSTRFERSLQRMRLLKYKLTQD
jgi:hypothetical protein